MPSEILTIGHSTLEYDRFLALLRTASVTAVADVRSSPNSRLPHFNEEALRKRLQSDGIAYVFLGAELGGRPEKPEYYCEGVADYEKMAGDEMFKSGIERVAQGAQKYRIALMCSEHNPLDCHRCLLVGRALSKKGFLVRHILQDGRDLSQANIEEFLIRECGHGGEDMFDHGDARIAQAYRERTRQVAYRNTGATERNSAKATASNR